MRFRTAGTTEYELQDIQETDVRGMFTGKLARFSDHGIYNIRTGKSEDINGEFHQVIFIEMPQVGRSFEYVHPVWDGCTSSTISEILEE